MSKLYEIRNLWVPLALLFLPLCLEAADEPRGGLSLNDFPLMENLRTINDYYDKLNTRLGIDSPRDNTESIPQETFSSPADGKRNFVMTPTAGQAPIQGMLYGDGFTSKLHSGYRDGKRDPFSPTNQMLEFSSRREGGLQFQPLNQAVEVPLMHLRGLVQDKDGKLAALLEIENSGIHVVREGDTVGLYDMGSNSVVRVRKINRLNLVVEAGSLGQLIIVR